MNISAYHGYSLICSFIQYIPRFSGSDHNYWLSHQVLIRCCVLEPVLGKTLKKQKLSLLRKDRRPLDFKSNNSKCEHWRQVSAYCSSNSEHILEGYHDRSKAENKTQISFYISEFSYKLIRESKLLQDIWSYCEPWVCICINENQPWVRRLSQQLVDLASLPAL